MELMTKTKNRHPTRILFAIEATPAPDLNSATLEELAGWSVLGPELAQELVTARPFEYWTDLRRLPGFTAAVIGDLREAGARLEPMEACV
jgi:DNA uptake protein ComE-like DNA-binding protein